MSRFFRIMKNPSLFMRSTFVAALLFVSVPTGQLYARDESQTEENARQESPIVVLNELKGLKSKVEFCGRMTTDRAQRLRCYDNISEEYGYIDTDMTKETEEKLAQFGFWSVNERKSEIGDTSIYLRIDSSNAARSPLGHERFPTLIVRCKNKKTDAYIDWGSPLGNTQGYEKTIYVGYRIDGGEEKAQEWEFSLDYYSAFSPKPIEFVRELKGKKKLVVEITPYNQSMAALLFHLDGLESALAILVDRCYNELR